MGTEPESRRADESDSLSDVAPQPSPFRAVPQGIRLLSQFGELAAQALKHQEQIRPGI